MFETSRYIINTLTETINLSKVTKVYVLLILFDNAYLRIIKIRETLICIHRQTHEYLFGASHVTIQEEQVPQTSRRGGQYTYYVGTCNVHTKSTYIHTYPL